MRDPRWSFDSQSRPKLLVLLSITLQLLRFSPPPRAPFVRGRAGGSYHPAPTLSRPRDTKRRCSLATSARQADQQTFAFECSGFWSLSVVLFSCLPYCSGETTLLTCKWELYAFPSFCQGLCETDFLESRTCLLISRKTAGRIAPAVRSAISVPLGLSRATYPRLTRPNRIYRLLDVSPTGPGLTYF